MRELIQQLSKAPDSVLDASMTEKIKLWADPPTAIQVLEVLDHSIHGALASGMGVQLLQLIYREALQREGTTHEALLPSATWRGPEH